MFSLYDAEGDDIYNEKPLPFVIGTAEFDEDPLVGLGDNGSGSDLEDEGEEGEEGEESEGEEDIERYSVEDEEEYMQHRQVRVERRSSAKGTVAKAVAQIAGLVWTWLRPCVG